MFQPTLRQLRHLAALAEHRHFGRAAVAAHVTQSTLSASLKELEAGLGATLVDRARRRVVLTPMGQEIVARARRILVEADELARAAARAAAPLTGTIRLGAIPTIGPFLLPRLLPALRAAYPALRLYLVEDLTQRLLEQLHAGALDALLIALPYDGGAVETATLARDPFSFVCPRDHPLARRRRLVARDLAEEKLLLLQDGHCLRAHALEACDLGDPRTVEPFQATSLLTLVQMVDNGLGVTLLPQVALDSGILKGTALAAVPLAGARSAREIGLAWRRGTGRADEFRLLARVLTDLIAGRTPSPPPADGGV